LVCSLSAVACSGGGDEGDPSSQPQAGSAAAAGTGGGAAGSAAGGASAAGASAGGSGGVSSGTAGIGGVGGTGGAGGAAGASVPDDAKPDYGMPSLEPDTSTDKVADCAGAADMTLCEVVTMPDRWYDVCVAGVCVSPGCGSKDCNTPGPHFRIPPLEGHLALEKQPGEQPVTIDLITGLHWTSCPAGLSGASCELGAGMELAFEDALAYCDALSWGGHDDWYLPDMYELTSLADLMADSSMTTVSRPDFLSDLAFPQLPEVQGFYWSTTFLDNDYLKLSTGQNEGSYPSIASDFSFDPYPALCVRRGFSEPMPAGERFVETDTGEPGSRTIEDRATGLVFQGCPSELDGSCGRGEYDSVAAVAHCRDLVWGGADDWRIPTYKEMQGAFDTIATGFDAGLGERFGPISGAYVLVAPEGLLSLDDMGRVGRNPDKAYSVICARGPYAQ
jgi:hypothetical protein